jgi:hypothetical protein
LEWFITIWSILEQNLLPSDSWEVLCPYLGQVGKKTNRFT